MADNEAAVTLIGFPTDVNSSFLRGPAMAPALIRAAMWSEAGNPFSETGLNLGSPRVLFDAGDVTMYEDQRDRRTIEQTIAERLTAGDAVLSIGGDHSITYPIVKAYAARFADLAIVHVDAHPDLYPSFGGNRFSHACPFARILEETLVRAIVQIGIRSTSVAQREIAERYGVRWFGPSDLNEALDALPQGPVYLTVDLDGLDPAFAPGVSHPEPGGLTTREVLDLVKALPGPMVGADIVEYNPVRDVNGATAAVAAKFAREFAARLYSDRSRA